MEPITRFLQDESAATGVEYAVMLSLILLAAISAILQFGTQSGGLWGGISGDISSSLSG
jgi:Flp pilus assembly pilin Flp